jgi:hypothetical protein
MTHTAPTNIIASPHHLHTEGTLGHSTKPLKQFIMKKRKASAIKSGDKTGEKSLQFPAELVKEVLSEIAASSTAAPIDASVERIAEWEQHAPAVLAQRDFLGTGHDNSKNDCKHLLKRRVQDRIEALNEIPNYKSDRKKREESEGIVLPGPVDPKCNPKLDPSKYGFYIETQGELSDDTTRTTRSFFLDSCKLATNDGGGDFVLFLDIPDFFHSESPRSSRPFDYYFEKKDHVSVCEGIRHYPIRPCPIRVYVTDKASGLQADLFDTQFGRLWLHNSFHKYGHGDQEILPMIIRMEMEKEKDGAGFLKSTGNDNSNSRVLHIFNKCEGLELHGEGRGSGNMGIALYRCGLELRIRIQVESFSNNGAGDFFGEKLQFR